MKKMSKTSQNRCTIANDATYHTVTYTLLLFTNLFRNLSGRGTPAREPQAKQSDSSSAKPFCSWKIEVEVKLYIDPRWPIRLELNLVSVALSNYRYFFLPLDGMLGPSQGIQHTLARSNTTPPPPDGMLFSSQGYPHQFVAGTS